MDEGWVADGEGDGDVEGGEGEGAAGCGRCEVERWGCLGGEVEGVGGGGGVNGRVRGLFDSKEGWVTYYCCFVQWGICEDEASRTQSPKT